MDDSFRDADARHIWHPFTQEEGAPPPIPIRSGQGTRLFGEDGRIYLDLIGSWWVNIHGHAHPHIAAAIARQAQTLEQVIFAGFTHRPAVHLAQELTRILPPGLDQFFFSDNGSTAVEVALKMALQHAVNRGENRRRFVVFEGSYHGDTVGAMSVGRSSGFFTAFEPLLFEVDTLPFPATWNDDPEVETKERLALQALDHYLQRHGKTCAGWLVEPLVQGAGGMRLCRPSFLREAALRVRAQGIPLLFDEVMTGFGRTGSHFACQQTGITPDLICLSKGLTGGFLPLGLTVCTPEIRQAFRGDRFDRAFAHGHSFTANPISCAAAVASLEILHREKSLEKVAAIQAIHRERLAALAGHPRISRPRSIGVIAALDLDSDRADYHSPLGPALKAFFLEEGLLIRPLGNVVYLLPPFCITPDELHRGWDGIEKALRHVV
ncbi:MAG: adenosylmethionine--8-amino-7-oxononanoate transaminase [Magnetococcales bacterium]|nr:adenosylmethionine--8-amino-7-oxononanoate transaminase [Magnetococcales bacterium]